MTLAVLGAGFGRTGTLSLKLGLEQLGFGGCYHMLEVFTHPEHVAIWSAAADGKPVDWNALFAGYRSAVDWPPCHFWRELAARFPDAKVVLTVRSPESWHASVMNTIYPAMQRAATDPQRAEWLAMARKIVVDQTFGGGRRIEDRAHAIAVFERHNAEVQRVIPRERLLVYEVSQGWKPLCDFLGVAIPAEPFPRTNTTEEFQARVQQMS